jgi:hypothetical protein
MTNLQRRIRKLEAFPLFAKLSSRVGSPSCTNANAPGRSGRAALPGAGARALGFMEAMKNFDRRLASLEE